ncbi:NIPSNAP family protein [Flavobacterium restrictum]|uniref:NIPSNAP family containing protein n=1 Tax=Flavobacterium restrictum TaxID=2594428 RepID=A0A553E0B5_9FLAO|nr:NIPSNAP family protein [Flavobacterium restrictum]TRX38332.1 NIPSNAP family containing protein [Flavobacterium restrictum]
MKKSTSVLFALVFFFSAIAFSQTATLTKKSKQSSQLYQLKTYVLHSVMQEQIVDNYLKDAYLPALKKIGITTIGVFKPKTNPTDSIKKIIVLLPLQSMEQFLSIESKLNTDKSYLTSGKTYLEAVYNQPPYVRIESIILKAFVDHPKLNPTPLRNSRANRVYELRSYESATEAIYKNKVTMFNDGGEIKLFDLLGFNAVFYAEVISGPKMPNLMYMTTFENQESREEHWKSFVASPEWKALIAMEKYKNNISHMDILFLYPTDYSDY